MNTASLPQRFGKAALDQLYRGKTQQLRPLMFLDFDDVLCINKPYGGYDVFSADARPADLWEKLWSPEAVTTLHAVAERFDPEVVLTTSWLRLMERQGFEQVFARTGLTWLASRLHKAWEAPAIRDKTRWQAIEAWLFAHYLGQPLVVLDDLYSGTGLQASRLFKAGHVVLCEVGRGLHAGLQPAIERALSSR